MDLPLHMAVENGALRCSCRMKFKSKIELNKHVKLLTTSKLFACEKCGQWFSRSVDRQRHVRSHKNAVRNPSVGPVHLDKPYAIDMTKPGKFACTCGRKMTCGITLFDHIRTTPGPGKRFVCGICSRVFAECDQLRRHFMFGHKILELGPVDCERCSRSFSGISEFIMGSYRR